jgi:hypothetical protein
MKNTVKHKVLQFVANNGTITRKELQFAIFKAQGKKGKEAETYRNGYYCVGIGQWVRDGLLEQPSRGKFKITSLGKKYIDNPQLGNALVNLEYYKKFHDRTRKNNVEAISENNDLKLEIRGLENLNELLRAKLDRVLDRLNFHSEISGIVESHLDLLECAIADHFELESDIPTGTQEIAIDKVRVELTNIFNGYVKLNL